MGALKRLLASLPFQLYVQPFFQTGLSLSFFGL